MTAFYAPLKPPDHPTPSGDRAMARALLDLLGAPEIAEPFGPPGLVSRLRTRDGKGDAAAQDAILAEASAEAARLADAPAPALWLTYHNYYKAPDLLGPRAAARGALYAIVEASRSRRRAEGAWARFAAAAEAASDAADVIFCMTARDWPALDAARPERQRLVSLAPFLPMDTLPTRSPSPGPASRRLELLAVAMLRAGDKAASYAALASALARVRAPWRLTVVGDGPERLGVEATLGQAAAASDGVLRMLGRLDGAALHEAYAAAELFVWPGVNEAYGLVYLEAQAAGLAVIAEDRPGVRDVARAGAIRTPPEDPAGFAAAIDALAADPARRRALAAAGQAQMAAEHLRPAARDTIATALREAAAARSEGAR